MNCNSRWGTYLSDEDTQVSISSPFFALPSRFSIASLVCDVWRMWYIMTILVLVSVRKINMGLFPRGYSVPFTCPEFISKRWKQKKVLIVNAYVVLKYIGFMTVNRVFVLWLMGDRWLEAWKEVGDSSLLSRRWWQLPDVCWMPWQPFLLCSSPTLCMLSWLAYLLPMLTHVVLMETIASPLWSALYSELYYRASIIKRFDHISYVQPIVKRGSTEQETDWIFRP